jgi:uncharacterized membrane protein
MKPVDRVGAIAGFATMAGMIATPLLPQRGLARKILSSVVVTGMFVNTTANAVRTWGGRRAGTAGAITAVATTAVERIGTQTGLPFGQYGYTTPTTGRARPGHCAVGVVCYVVAVARGSTCRAR